VIDDEQSRLAEASWAIYALGANTVVVDGLLADGVGSRVWRLAAIGRDGARQYAVKWFRPAAREDGRAVATEYAALRRLADVLPGLPTRRFALRCPVPVQAWDWGYAMSAVPGVPLPEAVSRRVLAPGEYGPIAGNLIGALLAYHHTQGAPYGDFHPGNVLLGPDRDLYLLAPSEPAGPTAHPLAADLAYWIVATALHALRASVRHPRAAAHGIQLARELAGTAISTTGDPGLATEIDRCLAARFAGLRRNGLRRRAVATAAERLLTTLDRP
jgi:hypothetical protein